MGRVNLILDEAGNLGPMRVIDEVVTLFRGYGIRAQLYYQNLGQLKKCFPKEQDTTALANISQVFFAVHENATAEYISNRLGDETIEVESGGTGSSYSLQSGSTGGQRSTSETTSRNSNWNQMGRRLLKPEEILAMSERMCFSFVPGMAPFVTSLERYYEKRNRPEGLDSSGALLIAFHLFVVMTYGAIQACHFLKG